MSVGTNARPYPSSRRWRSALVAACLVTGGSALLKIDPPSAMGQRDLTNERSAQRRAGVDAARGQVNAAIAQVKAASERVRAAWTSRPEMLQAQQQLDQARIELDRVSGPAFERLRQTQAYKDADEQEAAATQRVADEQAKTEATQPAATQVATMPAGLVPGDTRPIGADETDLNVAIPSDEQLDAAANRLEVVTKRHKLEEDAARTDPATAEARAKFEAATAEVKALQAQMRAAVLNDPEYKAAQERLGAARAELARAASANY